MAARQLSENAPFLRPSECTVRRSGDDCQESTALMLKINSNSGSKGRPCLKNVIARQTMIVAVAKYLDSFASQACILVHIFMILAKSAQLFHITA